MSNLQAAIKAIPRKVADQLIARLFDQRQFTSGEINYLIREISEKNNLEGNFEKILKLNQDVCVISDTYAGDLFKVDDATSKSILNQVNANYERAKRILQLEEEYQEKECSTLRKVREERDRLKQERLKDVTTKLEALNETLIGEGVEMERKFLLFEDNLRNKPK